MPLIIYNGHRPQLGQHVFIAPTAILIGDVVIEDGVSIWFGAVLRADQNRILVQAGANIQDNAVVHTNVHDGPTIVGPDVSVGHGVALEGCRIERGAVIGMNAVLLGGAHIGERAMVAAGAVVPAHFDVPAEQLAAGVPAEVKKPLSGNALRAVETTAAHYHSLRDEYLAQSIGHPAQKGTLQDSN